MRFSSFGQISCTSSSSRPPTFSWWSSGLSITSMVSLKNLDGNSGFFMEAGSYKSIFWGRFNLPRRVYISIRSSLQWLCRNPNAAPKSVFPWLLRGIHKHRPLWRWRQMQNIVCYSFWKWKGILTAVSCCIRWRKKCAPFPNHTEYSNIKFAECIVVTADTILEFSKKYSRVFSLRTPCVFS